MSPKLKCLIMFMLAGLSPASFADAEEDRDALRIEVENLLQYGRLSIGDVDIASGELLAEFYERRDYAPAWTDKEQIAELISAIKATAGDGLDPSDYHLDDVLFGDEHVLGLQVPVDHAHLVDWGYVLRSSDPKM